MTKTTTRWRERLTSRELAGGLQADGGAVEDARDIVAEGAELEQRQGAGAGLLRRGVDAGDCAGRELRQQRELRDLARQDAREAGEGGAPADGQGRGRGAGGGGGDGDDDVRELHFDDFRRLKKVLEVDLLDGCENCGFDVLNRVDNIRFGRDEVGNQDA